MDKHLTVDTAAGTDAYDGYRDLGGNARGKIGRNLFEHYGEASRLLQKVCVVQELFGLGLLLGTDVIGAELMY